MPLTGMKSNLIEISGTPSMDRLRPSVYRARLHLAFVFLLFFLFLSLLGFFFVFRCGTRWLEKLFRGRIAGAVPHCRMCLLQEKLHERGAVLHLSEEIKLNRYGQAAQMYPAHAPDQSPASCEGWAW